MGRPAGPGPWRRCHLRPAQSCRNPGGLGRIARSLAASVWTDNKYPDSPRHAADFGPKSLQSRRRPSDSAKHTDERVTCLRACPIPFLLCGRWDGCAPAFSPARAFAPVPTRLPACLPADTQAEQPASLPTNQLSEHIEPSERERKQTRKQAANATIERPARGPASPQSAKCNTQANDRIGQTSQQK